MFTYDKLTEEELLKRVADNDLEAAKYIYDKYSPCIYGMILKETENTKGSEEILISTFISFFKASYKKSSIIPQCIFISLYQIALKSIKHGNGLYISHKAVNTENPIYNYKPKRG